VEEMEGGRRKKGARPGLNPRTSALEAAAPRSVARR
jgi:hypothetical protein